MEETQNLAEQKAHSGSPMVDKITYWILGVTMLLLPFFFIPSISVPFQMGKGILFALGVVLALAFYVVGVIRNGSFSLPTNLLFLSVLLIPVVFLMSALFNNSGQIGFFGFSFEVGTVSFIFLGTIFLFLVSQLFNSKEKIFYSYLGFLVSSLVVALFQMIRLIAGPDTLSFGMLTRPVDNLIGNWNELALFFGASAILSFITIEMVKTKSKLKALLYTVFVLSVLALMLINFSTAWYIVGLFSLGAFIYLVSFDRFSQGQYSDNSAHTDMNSQASPGQTSQNNNRKISYLALVLIVVSALFIVSGPSIVGGLNDSLGISNVEVRPSFSTTWDVARSSLANSPLLGSGPNHFSEEWLAYKPLDINSTIFWNSDFAYGIGLLPTFLVTTGVLGIASWIFLLVMIVWMGVKGMFSKSSSPFSRYLITSSFMVSLYLWITATFYVPNVAMFALAFAFTGLFASSLLEERVIKQRPINLSNNPKTSFVSVLVLVMVLIGVVTLGYSIVQKSTSFVYFQNGIISLQDGQDIDKAEEQIVKAANAGGFDIYHRALAEINLLRLNDILSQSEGDPDALIEQAQLVLAKSIQNARTATEINGENYQNWLSLARIYAGLVPPPLEIPGAYDNAKAAYEKALEGNPKNPEIYLSLARLEISNNDLDAAREYINKSIELKDNYAEAHFLLAQLEVTQGNTLQAIKSLEKTILLSPNNPGLMFQLGLLKYNAKDWEGAITPLKSATILVPDYANAKYFLGLSYDQLGRTEEAIKEFEEIELTNPDNEEIKFILSNLREGNSAFTGVEPPLDDKPEDREELPVEDNQ